MTDAITIAVLGFFLGMRHATDPDHVIAVTTIVARQGKTAAAAAIGALWGLGHTVTIIIVGGGIILFRWVIPARLGLSMEVAVGAMLVILGVVALRPQHHDIAAGPHDHLPRWVHRHLGNARALERLRPFIVGLVHGLAGSAGVALLVLATIREPAWAMMYLLIFGCGTLAGMALITMVIAVPFRAGRARSARAHHVLRVASGVVSVAFGLFVIYDMGIVHHLFSAAPTWAPK